MQFSNHHRVRVEALQTAAPKDEVEIANPPCRGRLAESRRGVILRADVAMNVCHRHSYGQENADQHRNRRSARENGRGSVSAFYVCRLGEGISRQPAASDSSLSAAALSQRSPFTFLFDPGPRASSTYCTHRVALIIVSTGGHVDRDGYEPHSAVKVMGNVVLRPAPRIDSARAGWLAQQAAHSVTHGHQSHRTAARLEAGERGLIDKTDRQDLGLGLDTSTSPGAGKGLATKTTHY